MAGEGRGTDGMGTGRHGHRPHKTIDDSVLESVDLKMVGQTTVTTGDGSVKKNLKADNNDERATMIISL